MQGGLQFGPWYGEVGVYGLWAQPEFASRNTPTAAHPIINIRFMRFLL
jgi:hypothetical protein